MTDQPDPAAAITPEDLAACLRDLHLRADSPSYRTLQDRTRRAGGPLPGTRLTRVPLRRTTLSDVLRGTVWPRKAFLLTFADQCGVDLQADRRWEQAWDRIAPQARADGGESPADQARRIQQMEQQIGELTAQLAAERDRGPAGTAEQMRRLEDQVGDLTGQLAAERDRASGSAAAVRQMRELIDGHRGQLAAADREVPAVAAEPVVLSPASVDDTREAGERFRDGTPVVLLLGALPDDDAQRAAAFAAGLVFALRGSIDKLTDRVLLLVPAGAEISAADRAAIEAGFRPGSTAPVDEIHERLRRVWSPDYGPHPYESTPASEPSWTPAPAAAADYDNDSYSSYYADSMYPRYGPAAPVADTRFDMPAYDEYPGYAYEYPAPAPAAGSRPAVLPSGDDYYHYDEGAITGADPRWDRPAGPT
jgi:cell division inhibitor SepF